MAFRHQYRFTAILCLLIVMAACSTSPQSREARFLKRGDALFAKKEYARAVIEFRNAAAAVPTDAEPHYRMGLSYMAAGEEMNAARAFQKAITLNPKHAGAQLKAAEMMASSRDQQVVAEAASRLRSLFGPSPDDPTVIETLALTEWKLGKPEEASKLLEGALQRFPTDLKSSVMLARVELAKNDSSGAEEVLRKAVVAAPHSPDAALALGNFYALTHKPEKAEPSLRKALLLDPKNGPALMSLGGLLTASKRLDEAEKIYKQVSGLSEAAYKPVHAMFLYQTGKTDAAIAEFEALANSDKNDRAARGRLLGAYFALGKTADADNLLRAALKRNPKDTDALLHRAEMRLRWGQMTEAEKDLTQVLHFEPNSAVAHFAMASVLQAQGQENNRRQELRKALSLNSGILPARLALANSLLVAKQPQAALGAIDEAPQSDKSDLRWILARNWVLLALGNTQDAKAGIDQALQQGKPPQAVFQQGVLRLIHRDYAGARDLMDELLKLDGTDLTVLDMLMQTYVDQNNTESGVKRLAAIASAQPKAAALQQMLGQWYVKSGNYASARKAFEAAKMADAHFLSADLQLTDLDLREHHNDSARQRLDPILAADPRNVTALLLLARTEYESGNRAAEIDAYRKAVALDQTNALALNNLAYELAANSPDEALKFAQQAAEMAPDNPNIQDTLGWIYYRKGIYSMAVRYLKTAVDRESNPRRQFHLGMGYLKTGEQTTGQKMVREALLKDPNLARTEQGW
jgi:tetratricopeptide (TPR) repeat protein